MTRQIKIQFDLIYECEFQKDVEGDLDYLHWTQWADEIRKDGKVHEGQWVIDKERDLKTRYEGWKLQAAENLLSYFKREHFKFIPDAIVRAPTSRPELQDDVFNKFRDLFQGKCNFSITDSIVKTKDGIEFSKDITSALKSMQRIIIIDDVYAKGCTAANIISLLGLEKSFIVVCPLLIRAKVSSRAKIKDSLAEVFRNKGIDENLLKDF